MLDPPEDGLEELRRAWDRMEEVKLSELLDQVGLDGEDAYLWPGAAENIAEQTPLDADRFIMFAKKDLDDGGLRGKVNALSNAKRAIDCQATMALRAIGVGDPDSSVPAKLELLQELGFIAPSLLQETNELRNKLEHEYREPEASEVSEALEVAALFVEAMRRTLWGFPTEFRIGSGPEIENPIGLTEPARCLMVKFRREEKRFDIEGSIDGVPVNTASVTPDQDRCYKSLVRAALALERPHQDGQSAISELVDAVSNQ